MGEHDLLLRGLVPRSIVDPTTKESEQKPSDLKLDGPSFEEILAARLPSGSVKLSPEAKEMLQAVGVELKPMDLDRIGKGIDRLGESGGQKGLLISEKVAMVVDVPERSVTAVTAREEIRDHVFSGVDSVMLID